MTRYCRQKTTRPLPSKANSNSRPASHARPERHLRTRRRFTNHAVRARPRHRQHDNRVVAVKGVEHEIGKTDLFLKNDHRVHPAKEASQRHPQAQHIRRALQHRRPLAQRPARRRKRPAARPEARNARNATAAQTTYRAHSSQETQADEEEITPQDAVAERSTGRGGPPPSTRRGSR